MTINNAGMKLIESFEGLRLVAYLPTVHDVWTIGYGHTSGVQQGDVCDLDQAEQWLVQDLEVAEQDVQALCPNWNTLTENQYAALVSLLFNVGRGPQRINEQSTIIKCVNANDYEGAAAAFASWRLQGGTILPGLVKRRAAEAALFQTPT